MSFHAFQNACESGNLDRAKWAFSLGGVNIHIDNEYPFRASCARGNLATWMYISIMSTRFVPLVRVETWKRPNGCIRLAAWMFTPVTTVLLYGRVKKDTWKRPSGCGLWAGWIPTLFMTPRFGARVNVDTWKRAGGYWTWTRTQHGHGRRVWSI